MALWRSWPLHPPRPLVTEPMIAEMSLPGRLSRPDCERWDLGKQAATAGSCLQGPGLGIEAI